MHKVQQALHAKCSKAEERDNVSSIHPREKLQFRMRNTANGRQEKGKGAAAGSKRQAWGEERDSGGSKGIEG